MRRVFFACAMILMASSLSAQPAPTTRPAELRERVQKVAGALPWFGPYDAMVGREAWGPNRAEVVRLVSSLDGDWTPDEVRPLSGGLPMGSSAAERGAALTNRC